MMNVMKAIEKAEVWKHMSASMQKRLLNTMSADQQAAFKAALIPPPPKVCLPKSTNDYDPGWDDAYGGWFDLQDCNGCNDYCRWVNGTGSGGNPMRNTTNPTT